MTYLVGGQNVAARIQALVTEARMLLGGAPDYALRLLVRRIGKKITLRYKWLKRLPVNIFRFARNNGLISFVKRSGLSALYWDINNRREEQPSLRATTDADVFGLFRNDLRSLEPEMGFDCAAWLTKG